MGTVNKETPMPFKKVLEFETYVDQLKLKYDVNDFVFTGYLIEFYEFSFKKVKRSDYGKGSDCLYKFNESERKICFTPTKRNSFPKCIQILTGKPYYEKFFRNYFMIVAEEEQL